MTTTKHPHPRPLARATLLLALAAALALSGCAHFQAWGQKSSGQPAVMGGTFNFPIGK